MSKKQKQEFSLHYALAGSLSGITQKTLVQPLDLVKTRMQVCVDRFFWLFQSSF
jgi:hypothetical protein